MPGSAANVDWLAVQRRFEAGETSAQIAATVDATRQAIDKRAKRHGWKKPGEAVESSPDIPTTAPNWLAIAGKGEIVAGTKDTPERRALVLQCLSEAMSLTASAAYAGLDPKTVKAWREADPVFDAQCREASATWQRAAVAKINTAPDWRASGYLLERHPDTREDWGGKTGGAGGATINVIVNVPRAAPDSGTDTITIEAGG